MRYDADNGLKELEGLLVSQRLIIMAGSGVSVAHPSNLPTWEQFLTEFIKTCQELADLLLTNYSVNPRMKHHLEEFKPTVQDGIKNTKDPLRVAAVLTNQLREIQKLTGIQVHDEFDNWFRGRFGKAVPNENHNVIVATNYPIILTTNYDLLFEDAAAHQGFKKFRGRSYNFTDETAMAAALFHREPCIIHLHGKYNKTDLNEIVITADDYRHIEKVRNLTRIMEAMFLGYSALFVGYGGTDAHLEALTSEMGPFFKTSMGATSYILLTEKEADRIAVRHRQSLGMDVIAVDDYAKVTEFLKRVKDIAPRT